jgi:hypothetical protein
MCCRTPGGACESEGCSIDGWNPQWFDAAWCTRRLGHVAICNSRSLAFWYVEAPRAFVLPALILPGSLYLHMHSGCLHTRLVHATTSLFVKGGRPWPYFGNQTARLNALLTLACPARVRADTSSNTPSKPDTPFAARAQRQSPPPGVRQSAGRVLLPYRHPHAPQHGPLHLQYDPACTAAGAGSVCSRGLRFDDGGDAAAVCSSFSGDQQQRLPPAHAGWACGYGPSRAAGSGESAAVGWSTCCSTAAQ